MQKKTNPDTAKKMHQHGKAPIAAEIFQIDFFDDAEHLCLHHRLNNKPRQDTVWSISIEAVRHLIMVTRRHLWVLKQRVLLIAVIDLPFPARVKCLYLNWLQSEFKFEN